MCMQIVNVSLALGSKGIMLLFLWAKTILQQQWMNLHILLRNKVVKHLNMIDAYGICILVPNNLQISLKFALWRTDIWTDLQNSVTPILWSGGIGLISGFQ